MCVCSAYLFIRFCLKLVRGQNSSDNLVGFVLSSWGCPDELSNRIQIAAVVIVVSSGLDV